MMLNGNEIKNEEMTFKFKQVRIKWQTIYLQVYVILNTVCQHKISLYFYPLTEIIIIVVAVLYIEISSEVKI